MTSVHPPGWYYAHGDPPGTQRYWDGLQWHGAPQAVPGVESHLNAAAHGVRLALWRRLFARWIDWFIWYVSTVFVGVVLLGGSYGFASVTDSEDLALGLHLLVVVLAGATGVVYEYAFLLLKGATPGKMALQIKVVNDDGSALTNPDVTKRLIMRGLTLIPIVGGLIWVAVTLITAIMILVDDRNQGLSDKLAGTIVVMND